MVVPPPCGIGPEITTSEDLALNGQKLLCIQVGSVGFDRQMIADHANNLASNVQGNLKRSLEAIGVVRCLHNYLIALAMYPSHASQANQAACEAVRVGLPLLCIFAQQRLDRVRT